MCHRSYIVAKYGSSYGWNTSEIPRLNGRHFLGKSWSKIISTLHCRFQRDGDLSPEQTHLKQSMEI